MAYPIDLEPTASTRKESVADYSHLVRTLCLRLGLPRSDWTHYFIQGLRPEIRDYVILQQADHLDEAENFAQLKEFHGQRVLDFHTSWCSI